jgi:hypothetical protein
MALIFVGDFGMVDQEVLAVAQTFPPEFVFFAEFTLSRNVDWLMLRPNGMSPAALVLTELKRCRATLRGRRDQRWERRSSHGRWYPHATRVRDENPYRQAVGAAKSLSAWLASKQPWFKQGMLPAPRRDFRVWPTVLLLSPPGIEHCLSLGRSDGLQALHCGLPQWAATMKSWQPHDGIPLNLGEIMRLADVLGLHLLESPDSVLPNRCQVHLDRVLLREGIATTVHEVDSMASSAGPTSMQLACRHRSRSALRAV